MDVGREIAAGFARAQADTLDDLLDLIGHTWWSAHRHASALEEGWAHDLDAELLQTMALARETVKNLA